MPGLTEGQPARKGRQATHNQKGRCSQLLWRVHNLEPTHPALAIRVIGRVLEVVLPVGDVLGDCLEEIVLGVFESRPLAVHFEFRQPYRDAATRVEVDLRRLQPAGARARRVQQTLRQPRASVMRRAGECSGVSYYVLRSRWHNVGICFRIGKVRAGRRKVQRHMQVLLVPPAGIEPATPGLGNLIIWSA